MNDAKKKIFFYYHFKLAIVVIIIREPQSNIKMNVIYAIIWLFSYECELFRRKIITFHNRLIDYFPFCITFSHTEFGQLEDWP